MITPLRDLVLVALRDINEPQDDRLVQVVRSERQPSTHADVLRCGPEVLDVVPGRRVVISRLQGIAIGDEQLLLPESAILAMEPLDITKLTCNKELLPWTADSFSDELLDDAGVDALRVDFEPEQACDQSDGWL